MTSDTAHRLREIDAAARSVGLTHEEYVDAVAILPAVADLVEAVGTVA